MNLILDAAVIVKLVLHEDGSKEAREAVTDALKKGMAMYTVDVALAEALNVLWRHVDKVKDLKADEAKLIAEDLMKVFDKLNIIKTREVAAPASQMSLSLNITAYDSLYLAAAQTANGTLYTADQKLCSVARTARRDIATKLLKVKTASDAKSTE